MAKVAMFLARSPGPPLTGRKAVINTSLSALRGAGHEVDLFILAKPAALSETGGQVCWLGTPSKLGMVGNAFVSVLGGVESLNEALFRSRRMLARTRRLRGAYDFAIADTIRAAPYAAALGVPWHLDLDDLLSSRYEKYVERPDELTAELVLGYYRHSAPRIAGALPKAALLRLLRAEAERLRRREVYWARKATTVSLVSPTEAETFARTAGRHVHSLPMGIRIPAHQWTAAQARPARAAFLGGLDYKPNLDALLYYQREVYPLMKSVSGLAPMLHHIGKSPSSVRSKFLPEVVSFDGYVADVVPRLSEAMYFVAPMVSGTGIKTKVLEAMALGLPVIGTDHAVTGLKVEHKNHCFICRRPGEFAEGMQYLADAGVAEKMGMAARRYVEVNFSLDALKRRWASVVQELTRGLRRHALP